MDGDDFETVAAEWGAARAGGGATLGVPLHVREPERRRLTSLIRAVLDDSALTGQLLLMSGCSAALQRDIPATYLRALAAAERLQTKGINALQRRNRLVKKAEDYVTAHLDESIRMSRLCKEIGASARSLEYAFQAVYGMGAMRYLRTIRLNEVRKALMLADGTGTATVTSTAMEWGFWHLGEFAAAYKRLFGEVPSDTLRVAATRKATSMAASALRL
jgi:AraC family ethanolamine operon transcriptional activator